MFSKIFPFFPFSFLHHLPLLRFLIFFFLSTPFSKDEKDGLWKWKEGRKEGGREVGRERGRERGKKWKSDKEVVFFVSKDLTSLSLSLSLSRFSYIYLFSLYYLSPNLSLPPPLPLHSLPPPLPLPPLPIFVIISIFFLITEMFHLQLIL